jgi:hypothetical protein
MKRRGADRNSFEVFLPAINTLSCCSVCTRGYICPFLRRKAVWGNGVPIFSEPKVCNCRPQGFLSDELLPDSPTYPCSRAQVPGPKRSNLKNECNLSLAITVFDNLIHRGGDAEKV